MSLFGCFQFLAPTYFLEVIYPRYNPDTIIINWNTINISTHSWCLFLYSISSCIALYITWKPPHVQCKHKMYLNFGFVLITYIPFPFSFSLLYNSSSIYQYLHFAWHLVMYKLPLKHYCLLHFDFMLSPLSIRQIYWKYTSKVYLNYTSSILEVTWSILQLYFKYTSNILQPVELQKKKYTSSLYYFDKRSTFEAHFVKLN